MNRAEDVSEEGIVISTAAAFSGKGKVSRAAFEDIESNMAGDSHISCGMIFPDTAVVLMEGHIQAPMERILNAPMFADCLCKSGQIRQRSGRIPGIFTNLPIALCP